MSDGWTDVVLQDKVIGFVQQGGTGAWDAWMEADGHTSRRVGWAGSKQAAIDMVKAAYLRT